MVLFYEHLKHLKIQPFLNLLQRTRVGKGSGAACPLPHPLSVSEWLLSSYVDYFIFYFLEVP